MALTKKSKSGGFPKSLLLIALGIAVGAGIYITLVYFEKSPPSVQIEGNLKFLSKEGSYTLLAEDEQSGLRSIRLVLTQNGKEHVLFNKEFPRQGYTGKIGPSSYTQQAGFNYSSSGLQDGEAKLILTVRDYSLRNLLSGNLVSVEHTVTIDTVAPKINLLHAERYISNGGSGIVIYQTKDGAVEHGAEFGGHFHRGYLMNDEQEDIYIAYIALPYDAEEIGKAAVIAKDAAGNLTSYPFSPVFKKEEKKFDRINVSDNFLSTKIPEFSQYYPEMTGDLKEKYIYTNTSVRLANNAKIAELCQNPIPERLWEGRFIRMAGASKAGFADRRTYYYNGKEIDKQVHLGMDIASTRRAEVKAANKGKVVFADYLGIYGNMVLLDHGQGIFSLYSHLSKIDVVVDDVVDQGVVLGLTGITGMAGGDHLHFSMLVNGVFVTPKEWWDEQWVNVTIDGPLQDVRFQ
jgi:murein DD-endopeptidase MepM/ murein hydrolase activator NlpD